MKIKVQLICLVVVVLIGVTSCSNEKQKNSNKTSINTEVDKVVETKIKENKQEFEVEKDKITIHFELYGLNQEKQEDGTTKLNVEGISANYDENSLPFLSYVFALPQDTALDDIDVASWSATVHTIENIKIANLGISPIQSETGDDTWESAIDDGFKIKAFVQKYQGIPVVYVSIYPVVYNEELQQVKFIESGDFQLDLKEEPWDITHYDSLERVKNVVDNPDIIDSYIISEK
ncbi:hypothetical protein [Anaerosporobacter sp.]